MSEQRHIWTIEYDNSGNGSFAEWWNLLREGNKIAQIGDEEQAKDVARRLNATEYLSADEATSIALGLPDEYPLNDYARALEGKD